MAGRPSPAIVDTVYPDESGVNIRIKLFTSSQTYRFPDTSTVIPLGVSKLAVSPGPSVDPCVPSPAIVDTLYPDESGVNMRIRLLSVSDRYRFPDRSSVIPYGALKLELNPGPSEDPITPA